MSDTSNIVLFNTSCITYTNNTEYRAALRQFFRMNPVLCPTGYLESDLDDDDSETKDELLYDTTTTMSGISEIYRLTQNNTLFIRLYERAAGRIFSEDTNMGLTLLFCYDHFAGFVPVLVDFLNWGGEGVWSGGANYQVLYDNV